MSTSDSEPAGHRHAEQRQAERHLVGDQLRGRAHRAEERVLRARRPAAEHQRRRRRASRRRRSRGRRSRRRCRRGRSRRPRRRTGPKGMIASVATAVTIEITGAMAIIHGTAVSGVDCSLESSFSTSASGWSRPRGPTRFGPMRDWKRPSSLRSSQQDDRHDPEHEGEDHDRLHDQDERALELDDHAGRPPPARDLHAAAPSGSRRARPTRKTLPAGTPVRTTRDGAARGSPSGRQLAPRRRCRRPSRAGVLDATARRAAPVARKRSEGACSISGPAQSVRRVRQRAGPRARPGGVGERLARQARPAASADAASRSCQRTPRPPISSSVRPA